MPDPFETPFSIRATVILMLFSLVTIAFSAPLEITVEEVGKELVIDGRLEEAIYQQGRWETGFYIAPEWDEVDVSPSDLKLARLQTAFRIFSDGLTLFFVARMSESDSRLHDEVAIERDGAVRRDDSIEILLRVNEKSGEYYSFAVNSRGVLADTLLSEGGLNRRIDWQSSTRVATGREGTDWTVEMAIPLAELGADFSVDQWHIQVIRHRQAREGEVAETSTWSPAPTGGVERLEWFAFLHFPKAFDRPLLHWKLNTESPRITTNKGVFYVTQPIEIVNDSAISKDLMLRTVLTPASALNESSSTDFYAEQSMTIPGGSRRSFDAIVPIGSVGHFTGELRHQLIDARAATDLYGGTGGLVQLAYEQVRITLSQPGYRAAIYATQDFDTLLGTAQIVDGELELFDAIVRLTAADGQIYPGTLRPKSASHWSLEVNGIKDLAEGDALLEILHEEKTMARRVIRKLPYKKGEVWIDRHGVVHRDGKPFAAYGFLFPTSRAKTLAEYWLPQTHLNVFAPLPPRLPKEAVGETIHERIDALAKHGIYSGVYLYGAVPGLAHRKNKPLSEEEKEAYRQFARMMRDNPNFLYYYQIDEPEHRKQDVGPGPLQEIYEILKEEDPWHPVVITNHRANSVEDYLPAADISSPDAYPAFMQSVDGTPRKPSRAINVAAGYLSRIPLGTESYRARWKTPQAFNFGFYGVRNNRGPTADEMRTQQTVALIYGATGIVWYPENMAWDEPGVQSSVPYLSREFEALFSMFTGAPPEILSTNSTFEAGWVERADGRALLMVSNASFIDQQIELADERFQKVKEWQILGLNETMPGGTDKLTIRLKAHESMLLASPEVYFPRQLDWRAVGRLESELRAASRIPGNIAHFTQGAVAQALGIKVAKGRPTMLIDGMKSPKGWGFRTPRKSFKKGQGVQLDLPRPSNIQRICLIGCNILEGELQVKEGESWKTVAHLSHSQAPPFEQVFSLPGNAILGLRVIADRVDTSEGYLQIREIEAYEN